MKQILLFFVLQMANKQDEQTLHRRWVSFSTMGKSLQFRHNSHILKLSQFSSCDSISTVFVSMSACCAAGLGFHPNWMFLNCTVAVVLFYVAHWQTYITGTLRFGKFDVTEAQVCIMIIHLFSFFFGPSVWQTRFLGLQLWFLMTSFSTCTAFLVLVNFCRTFSKGGVGKNGSTVAGTSIISPIIPFLLCIVPAYIISEKSRSGLYLNHPVLYMLAFGLLAAKVSCRLVVSHMSKSEMNYFDSGLVGPLILFLNQYFNEFFPEYGVLWVAISWVTFDLCWYSMNVCLEMCDHFNIALFTIPYPPKVAKAPATRK